MSTREASGRIVASARRTLRSGIARALGGSRATSARLLRALGRASSGPRALALRRLLRRATRRALLGGGLALVVLGLLALCVRRIPPGGVGVLQARVGGGGFDPLPRGPGLVLALRGLWRLHVLDARTQLILFAPAKEGGDLPALRVRTQDGNVARVSVSVGYRLRAQDAPRVVAEGLRASWDDLARGAIERLLLVELGKLSSDALAGSATRLAGAEQVRARLVEELAVLHVDLVLLQVGAVGFPAEYEATLQKKQLSRQLARLERADVALEEQELVVKRLEMDIEREVRELRAEREQRVAELVAAHEAAVLPLNAEASAVRGLRAAEAERELAQLEAEGRAALEAASQAIGLERAALLGGRGGALWLARQAARELRLERVLLDSRDERALSVLPLAEILRAAPSAGAPGR